MAINSFRDLDAWKVAMELTLHVYEIIGRLPQNERFEMASQMRRNAVSVPSNVAEGHACGVRKRYRNHVRIAIGSVGELVTCIELCGRLGYVDAATTTRLDAELNRTSQLLHGVLRSIRRQLAAQGLAGLALLCGGLWLL
jgi:four helix bundle protein